MARPMVKAVPLSLERPLSSKPLLLVGPSLGTSSVLWEQVGALLADSFDVMAWDLPGHGISPLASEGFDVAELADAVIDLVDSIAPGTPFHYAGVSLGGMVGLQLGIKHGERLKSLSVLCSGAKLGTPDGWRERAGTVRSQGTAAMAAGSELRWFAAGFMEREAELGGRLLQSLREADNFSYAFCCEALAAFDVRAQLGRITVPTLAVAGAQDAVAPPSFAEEIVHGIISGGGHASAVTLDGVAHLAPAEAPAAVTELLRDFMTGLEND